MKLTSAEIAEMDTEKLVRFRNIFRARIDSDNLYKTVLSPVRILRDNNYVEGKCNRLGRF